MFYSAKYFLVCSKVLQVAKSELDRAKIQPSVCLLATAQKRRLNYIGQNKMMYQPEVLERLIESTVNVNKDGNIENGQTTSETGEHAGVRVRWTDKEQATVDR